MLRYIEQGVRPLVASGDSNFRVIYKIIVVVFRSYQGRGSTYLFLYIKTGNQESRPLFRTRTNETNSETVCIPIIGWPILKAWIGRYKISTITSQFNLRYLRTQSFMLSVAWALGTSKGLGLASQ